MGLLSPPHAATEDLCHRIFVCFLKKKVFYALFYITVARSLWPKCRSHILKSCLIIWL